MWRKRAECDIATNRYKQDFDIDIDVEVDTRQGWLESRHSLKQLFGHSSGAGIAHVRQVLHTSASRHEVECLAPRRPVTCPEESRTELVTVTKP